MWRAEQIGLAVAAGAAVTEREAAGSTQVIGVLVDLAVRGRNDEAVLVVGDRHHVVHVLDRLTAEADASGDILVDDAIDRLCAHISAHRQHALEPERDRLFLAGRERLARYLSGMRRTADVGHFAVVSDLAGLCGRLDGDSGGTYQTIGSVRYSGCSGNATFHSIAIL